MNNFLKKLEESEGPVAGLSENMWTDLMEKVVVREGGTLVFTFRNKMAIEVYKATRLHASVIDTMMCGFIMHHNSRIHMKFSNGI